MSARERQVRRIAGRLSHRSAGFRTARQRKAVARRVMRWQTVAADSCRLHLAA